MDKPNLKQLTIPAGVLFDENLTWPQKAMLSYFVSLQKANKTIYVNNEFLCKLTGLPNHRNIRINLAKLEAQGHIVRSQKGRFRIIEVSCSKEDSAIPLEGGSPDPLNRIPGSPQADHEIPLHGSYDHPDIKDNNKINNKCYVVNEGRLNGEVETAEKRRLEGMTHLQRIKYLLQGDGQSETPTQEQQTIFKKNNQEDFYSNLLPDPTAEPTDVLEEIENEWNEYCNAYLKGN